MSCEFILGLTLVDGDFVCSGEVVKALKLVVYSGSLGGFLRIGLRTCVTVVVELIALYVVTAESL